MEQTPSDEQGNVLAGAGQAAEFSPDIKKERVGCFRAAEISGSCSGHGASFMKGTKAQGSLSGSSPLGPGKRSWVNILDMEQGGTNSAASVQKKHPRSCGELRQACPSPGCRFPSPSVEQEGLDCMSW